MTAPDLIVVGAGAMGAWTALHARRAGLEVTLVDAWGPGHPRATSGDETRISRASHGDNAGYTRWSRDSLQAWKALGQERGETLFVEAGALWFARREDGFEAASITTLRAQAVPVERLSADDVRARWPQIGVDDIAFAVFEPEAGVLMARRGVIAATRAFEAAGGRLLLADVRPGRIEGSRLVEVREGDGRRRAAGAFVFATGPWLPGLFPKALGNVISVTKQDVLFLGPAAGDDRFGAERLPAWVDYDGAIYGLPAVDARGFKIAPDHYGARFDPTDGERLVDPASVAEVRGYVARRFPALADAPIVETRVCQYETTADTHFVIDRHPGLDNVWLVGGGSGHGFKHGPAIGERVVARLLDRDSAASAGPGDELFSIRRSRAAGAGLRGGSRPAPA